MTSIGVLYTPVPSARVPKILAAACINGLQLDIPKPPDFVFRETNKTPIYLARFPTGRVPGLALPDGSSIFESDAIAQYVAESGPNSQQLLGTTPLQRALIRQWISFAPDNVFTPVHDLIMWRVGYGTYEEKKEAKAMETLEKTLDILEATLSGEAKSKSGWLVECPEGKLSLADLSVASYLMFGFQFYIDKEIRSKYPETTEWYLRVVTDPSVGDAFAEVPTKPKMCEQRKIGGA